MAHQEVTRELRTLLTIRTRVREWFGRWSFRNAIGGYNRGGRIPWSKGYVEYRSRYISTVLTNAGLLVRFSRSEPLPANYGIGIDERCVEYPWVISRLQAEPLRCLDAGSALNHAYLLDHPALNNKVLHILTLAPEAQCFWRKRISYLYEDLRQIPIRDDFYDTVVSISTLEHVGFENSLFAIERLYMQHNANDFIVATCELWRVLKPGGQLLITVPFGVYTDFGSFQQFDLPLLHRLESSVEAIDSEHAFYQYTQRGWVLSDAPACAHSEYFPWCMLPVDQRSEIMPMNHDGAAAARAVACVRLVKPA